jgi:hypothetical protein
MTVVNDKWMVGKKPAHPTGPAKPVLFAREIKHRQLRQCNDTSPSQIVPAGTIEKKTPINISPLHNPKDRINTTKYSTEVAPKKNINDKIPLKRGHHTPTHYPIL